MTSIFSSKDLLQEGFTRLKSLAQKEPFPAESDRYQALSCLQVALLKHEIALLDALQKDFGHRAHEESRLLELVPVLGELKHAKKYLKKWMKPTRRGTHISAFPATAKIVYQPKGIVGVISPWNYPVVLSLGPLIGAIAAGNRVMLKVSEFCPSTNQVLGAILNEALGDKWVALVEGEADIANEFSQMAFDHLLFTGSTSVGRIVMTNAAEHLTPVTLELGGKSPLLVTPSADLKDTAKKLVFGKLVNAGQTCVAPDYVLCHQDQKGKLVEYIKKELTTHYPEGILSPDYTSMINERQLSRIKSYLEEANAAGIQTENLMTKGPMEQDGKLAFHILHEPSDDLGVMCDEIFGPILPILTYEHIGDAFDYVHQRPRPLAMYIFTQNAEDRKRGEQQIASGSLVINHTMIQVAQPDLPFGGIGPSGMGAYHAEEGFRTFSHSKSVLHKRGFNVIALLRPPYKRPIHRLFAKYWSLL